MELGFESDVAAAASASDLRTHIDLGRHNQDHVDRAADMVQVRTGLVLLDNTRSHDYTMLLARSVLVDGGGRLRMSKSWCLGRVSCVNGSAICLP